MYSNVWQFNWVSEHKVAYILLYIKVIPPNHATASILHSVFCFAYSHNIPKNSPKHDHDFEVVE